MVDGCYGCYTMTTMVLIAMSTFISATTMEHGAGEHVMEELYTSTTIKREVEEAAPSTAYIEIEIDVNLLKQEPGFVPIVKSEPAFLVKEEIPEDSWQGTDDQESVPTTSTHAIEGWTNVAAENIEQNELLHIKEEPEDIDLSIGPTVLQQMDSYYRINQVVLNVVKPQNTILSLNPKEALLRMNCGQVMHSQVRMASQKDKKPRLTSAEKMRAYRQRKREKQIQEISSKMAPPQNGCEKSAIIYKKKPPMTSAEKVRAYRQRQREKKMKENSSDFVLPQNGSENNDNEQSNKIPRTSNNLATIYKKPRLTSAEKMRAYRQRQREKHMQEKSSNVAPPQSGRENYGSEQSNTISSNGTDSAIIHKKPRMTSAEKVRAYRQRQREKKMKENASDIVPPQQGLKNYNSCQSNNIPRISTDSAIIDKKKPRMTSAEKVRAFRQRQREKKMKENSFRIAPPQNGCENYDSEQSNKLPSASTDSAIIHKKPRLTSAEKMRAYRQRQREKQMQENSSNVTPPPQNCRGNYYSEESKNIPSSTDSAIICKKPRLTSAEKMHAYRQRQTEKQMQEKSSNMARSQSNCENDSEQSVNIQSTSTDSAVIYKKKSQMTSAEKVRAYRQCQSEKQMKKSFSNMDSAVICKLKKFLMFLHPPQNDRENVPLTTQPGIVNEPWNDLSPLTSTMPQINSVCASNQLQEHK